MPFRKGASSKRAIYTAVQLLGPHDRPPNLRSRPPAHQHASQAGTPLLGMTLALPPQAEYLLIQPRDPGTHLSHPTRSTRMTRRIHCPIPLLVVFDETIGPFLSRSSHRAVLTVQTPSKMSDLAVWRCLALIVPASSLAAATHPAMMLCPTPYLMWAQANRQDLVPRMPRAMTFGPTPRAVPLRAS